MPDAPRRKELWKEFVAGDDVEKTGLAFETLPPENAVVRRVIPGTWAEEQGIKEGDLFVSVNGIDTADMTADEFVDAMQNRPLTLVQLAEDSASDADEAHDGASSLSESASDSEGAQEEEAEWGTVDMIAGDDVEKTGLSFRTLPPGEVMVQRVAAASWAEEQGFRAGDVIVQVNGKDVHDMTAQEFSAAMQKRPLRLRPAEETHSELDERSFRSGSSASSRSSRTADSHGSKPEHDVAPADDVEHAQRDADERDGGSASTGSSPEDLSEDQGDKRADHAVDDHDDEHDRRSTEDQELSSRASSEAAAAEQFDHIEGAADPEEQHGRQEIQSEDGDHSSGVSLQESVAADQTDEGLEAHTVHSSRPDPDKQVTVDEAAELSTTASSKDAAGDPTETQDILDRDSMEKMQESDDVRRWPTDEVQETCTVEVTEVKMELSSRAPSESDVVGDRELQANKSSEHVNTRHAHEDLDRGVAVRRANTDQVEAPVDDDAGQYHEVIQAHEGARLSGSIAAIQSQPIDELVRDFRGLKAPTASSLKPAPEEAKVKSVGSNPKAGSSKPKAIAEEKGNSPKHAHFAETVVESSMQIDDKTADGPADKPETDESDFCSAPAIRSSSRVPKQAIEEADMDESAPAQASDAALSPSMAALRAKPIDEVVKEFCGKAKTQAPAPASTTGCSKPCSGRQPEQERTAASGSSPPSLSRPPSCGCTMSPPQVPTSERQPSSTSSPLRPLSQRPPSLARTQSPQVCSPVRSPAYLKRGARRAWADLRGRVAAASAFGAAGAAATTAGQSKVSSPPQSPNRSQSPRRRLQSGAEVGQLSPKHLESRQLNETEVTQGEHGSPRPQVQVEVEPSSEGEASNQPQEGQVEEGGTEGKVSKYERLYEDFWARKKRREELVEQHLREVTGASSDREAHPSGVTLERLQQLHEEGKVRQKRREELAEQHFRQMTGMDEDHPRQHDKTAIARLLQPRKVAAAPAAPTPDEPLDQSQRHKVDWERILALYNDHKERAEKLGKCRADKALQEEEELQSMLKVTCGTRVDDSVFERLYARAAEQRKEEQAPEQLQKQRQGGDNPFERLYADFFRREATLRTKVRQAEALERQLLESESIHLGAIDRCPDLDEVFLRLYKTHVFTPAAAREVAVSDSEQLAEQLGPDGKELAKPHRDTSQEAPRRGRAQRELSGRRGLTVRSKSLDVYNSGDAEKFRGQAKKSSNIQGSKLGASGVHAAQTSPGRAKQRSKQSKSEVPGNQVQDGTTAGDQQRRGRTAQPNKALTSVGSTQSLGKTRVKQKQEHLPQPPRTKPGQQVRAQGQKQVQWDPSLTQSPEVPRKTSSSAERAPPQDSARRARNANVGVAPRSGGHVGRQEQGKACLSSSKATPKRQESRSSSREQAVASSSSSKAMPKQQPSRSAFRDSSRSRSASSISTKHGAGKGSSKDTSSGAHTTNRKLPRSVSPPKVDYVANEALWNFQVADADTVQASPYSSCSFEDPHERLGRIAYATLQRHATRGNDQAKRLPPGQSL